MNPLKLYGGVAALIAVLSFAYWFADKIGDSRELNVRNKFESSQDEQNAKELAGRERARTCHARGTDWLWNTETEQCDGPDKVPSVGR